LRARFWAQASDAECLALASDPGQAGQAIRRLIQRAVPIPTDRLWTATQNCLKRIVADAPHEQDEWFIPLSEILYGQFYEGAEESAVASGHDVLARLAETEWLSLTELPYVLTCVVPDRPNDWMWQVLSRKSTWAVARRMDRETNPGGEP
jgi:hypothetical protein